MPLTGVRTLMRRLIRQSLLLTLLLSFVAHAQIYRWVDEYGQVHYGDKIPPKYAKIQRETLNEQGLRVDVQEREKTDAERAAEAAKAARAEEAQRAEMAQQRYDRFLLSTYPTLAALDRAQSDRLAIMDGQLVNARKSREEAADALRILEERAERFVANDRPIPDRLASQLEAFADTAAEAERRIGSVQREREQVAQQFQRDRERWQALHSASRP